MYNEAWLEAGDDSMDEETKEKLMRVGAIALLVVGGAIAVYVLWDIVVDVFTNPRA